MNLKKSLLNKNTIWIALGILSILLSAILPPAFVEQYYSRGLFLFIRTILSAITGWLPFAAFYILFFVSFIYFVSRLVHFVKNKKSWPQKISHAVWSILALLSGIVFAFQFLWGFNYGRIPFEKQLNLDVKPLVVKDLREELQWAIDGMHSFRPLLEGVGEESISSSYLPDDIEESMRAALTQNLKEFGYPIPAKVRGRLLFPKGILLRISTAGVYIPFTGEGHIDPGLHHLQLPFVLAHEMSHAYGIGGEGDCNFLAYLACTRSDDLYLNYVGYLYYFRYVAPDYRAYRPEEYKEILENLPAGIKNDLQAIRDEMTKYPDIFPRIRNATYNAYLKAQGIDEGIKNYDRVTMLVRAWRLGLSND